ncbi:MAG: GNAT family N-acetyltransferase [Ginsengibacter sp.]
MKIQGEGFILRPFEFTDAKALAKHANNKKIYDNLRDAFPFPYDENDAKAFIAIVLKDNDPLKNFIIEIDGEAAGTTGFRPGEDVYRLNAEIGYWLGEMHWGKGLMPKVITALVKHLFENFEFERIFAIPFKSNIASARALEKAGFTQEALISKGVIKNGIVIDYYIYSILKNS